MASASASASGDWAWMAVVAGEELAKLEAAHPGRLGPLKAELTRLIAEPCWDGAGAFAFPFPVASPDAGGIPTWSSPSSSQPAAPADLMLTQESSTKKRNWVGGGGGAVGQEQGKRRRKNAASGVKDRADMAIERAEKCLRKIRAIKQSLLGFTD